MFRLLVILIVIIVALLRGGSLHNLMTIRLRWLPLVFGSLILQLLLFTPFRSAPLVDIATPWLYILSMLMLVAWVAVNLRIPGMLLMGVGLVLNLIAIASNGGYMPVMSDAVRIAGMNVSYGVDGRHNTLADFVAGQVQLWLLTDIIPIPFLSVFSVGDVLLTLGVSICCYRTIRPIPVQVPAPT